jgi:biopolymer transport protein ExbD
MRFQRPKTEIMEADLTPMIDMTFLLIAFFMIIMNFAEVDRAAEIQLPTSKLAKPPETIPDYKIILNLNEDGSVNFDGQRIAEIEFTSAILKREISAAARQRKPVMPQDISVIIRSHEDTPTGLVQKLIAKCQENELESFSLRVKEAR